MTNLDPSDLLKIANREMPFGKYKGRVLIDLPEAYVIWFHNNAQLNKGELGRLMAQLYEIKVNGLEYLFTPLRSSKAPPKPSRLSASLLRFPPGRDD